MARLQGSRWDTDLPLFQQEAVGCYSWGLVNGRTQCQFAWFHRKVKEEQGGAATGTVPSNP
jgi:hypothetical protein